MMLPKQRQWRNSAVHALTADVQASTSSSSRPAQGSLQWAMPALLIMSPASRFYLRLMLRRRRRHRRRRLSESLRFESCSHLLFPGKHTASEHKLKPLLLKLNNERSHVREVNQLLAFRRRRGSGHAAVLLHDPSTQDLALVQIAREEEIYDRQSQLQLGKISLLRSSSPPVHSAATAAARRPRRRRRQPPYRLAIQYNNHHPSLQTSRYRWRQCSGRRPCHRRYLPMILILLYLEHAH